MSFAEFRSNERSAGCRPGLEEHMRFGYCDELESFFTRAEGTAGLVSSWEALVGIAVSGKGGTRNPEARITDRRFSLGPAQRTAVSLHREVRTVLMGLPTLQQHALFAVYGCVAWPRCLDDVFGKGMGMKVTAKLGELIGVALLTRAAAAGFERDREALHAGGVLAGGVAARWKKRAAGWHNAGGWLVHVCLTEAPQLGTVRTEAAQLRAGAERAYAEARGPEARRTTQRRAPRAAWDPFAMPGSET